MRSLRAILGLAAVAFVLSGCGGGSGSTSSSGPAASASSPSTTASDSSSGSGNTNTGTGSGSGSGSGSGTGTGTGTGTPAPTTGSAKLAWSAPTVNTNGTALTDLAGYDIYYGTSPGSMTTEIQVANPATLSYVVTSLSAGTWYFAVTAYTNEGVQSARSNVGSKTIT